MTEIKVNSNEIKIIDDVTEERLIFIKYNNYICGVFDIFDNFCDNKDMVFSGMNVCIGYLLSNKDNFVFNTETHTLILKTRRCTFTFNMAEL
jgi:hypothetical protein